MLLVFSCLLLIIGRNFRFGKGTAGSEDGVWEQDLDFCTRAYNMKMMGFGSELEHTLRGVLKYIFVFSVVI